MSLFIEQFRYALQQRFLWRWILANVVGWTIGLYAGVLNPVCFAGAGVIAGLLVGVAQWWALRSTSFGISQTEIDTVIPNTRPRISQNARRWIVSTFAGAALGLIPALVLATLFVLISSGLAAILAGAVLGFAVGVSQWMQLKRWGQQITLWLIANTVGGAACGLLTVTPLIRGLPIGMLLGSALFGYLTGRVLERMLASTLQ